MGQDIHITILVDNSAARADLKSEHGLSLWIEYEGRIILFDVGQSDAIFHNAKTLGLNLEKVEALVLSHGHYDHTGPLAEVLTHMSTASIFVHPDALSTRFSRKVTGVREIGMSYQNQMLLRHLAQQKRVIWTSGPCEIFPGVTVMGQIPRHTTYEDTGGAFFLDRQCTKPDSISDDQALIVQSSAGTIVIAGCAHSGVINVLNYAQCISKQNYIKAFVGGMHLVNASENRMKNTMEMIGKLGVEQLIACHCTGEQAFEQLTAAFGSRAILSHVGLEIVI